MQDIVCTFDGCGRPRKGSAPLCIGHLAQLRRGAPLTPLMRRLYGGTIEQRFWRDVDISGEGCYLWTGAATPRGYGTFQHDGKHYSAHRFAWELANGQAIQPGLQVDHICHIRRCVRPEHLRLVTNKQNQENRRGPSKNSSTGFRGVSITKDGRFRARVWHNYRSFHAGVFGTAEEADAAAAIMRAALFTHSQECDGVDARG